MMAHVIGEVAWKIGGADTLVVNVCTLDDARSRR
jgi:hypothetical protein